MDEQLEMHSKQVIVVDNDAETTKLLAELLRSEGYAPLCYPAWLLSVECIERAQASLLILELGLGDHSSTLNLLGELRRNCRTHVLPVIVDSTDNLLLQRLAAPLSALGCVTLAKPFELDDFYASINMCLGTSCSQSHELAC
jgi:DNA-binding response OmpR family regulator